MNINRIGSTNSDDDGWSLVPAAQAAGQASTAKADAWPRNLSRDRNVSRIAATSTEQAFELSNAMTSNTVNRAWQESGRIIYETAAIKREQAEAILTDARKQVEYMTEQMMKGFSDKTNDEQTKVIQLITQTRELVLGNAIRAINTYNETVIDHSVNSTLRNYQQLAENSVKINEQYTAILAREQSQTRERNENKRHSETTCSVAETNDDDLSNVHFVVSEALANIEDASIPSTFTDEKSAESRLRKLSDEHHEHLAFIHRLYPTWIKSYVTEMLIVQQPYMLEEEGSFQVFPGVIRLRK